MNEVTANMRLVKRIERPQKHEVQDYCSIIRETTQPNV